MRRGGTDSSTSEMKLGDGSGRLVSFHRRTSRSPGAREASGLWKRFPSNCFGMEDERQGVSRKTAVCPPFRTARHQKKTGSFEPPVFFAARLSGRHIVTKRGH